VVVVVVAPPALDVVGAVMEVPEESRPQFVAAARRQMPPAMRNQVVEERIVFALMTQKPTRILVVGNQDC